MALHSDMALLVDDEDDWVEVDSPISRVQAVDDLEPEQSGPATAQPSQQHFQDFRNLRLWDI